MIGYSLPRLDWKLFTGIISDRTYDRTEENKLLPEAQKGSWKKCMGTKYHLVVGKYILQNYKKREANLHVAWVDYKKVHDMIPRS